MTTLLIIISSLLLVALIAVSFYCARLYGKSVALEKENQLLDAQMLQLEDSLRKSEDDARTHQVLREEQFVRIAALESENSALNERLDAQKEQFRTSLDQMRLEFKSMATEVIEKTANSSTSSPRRGSRPC